MTGTKHNLQNRRIEKWKQNQRTHTNTCKKIQFVSVFSTPIHTDVFFESFIERRFLCRKENVEL